MPTEALEFELPSSLIATRAVEPRDAARMLVCKRSDPGFLEHRRVSDLPAVLASTRKAGSDLLVCNTSRVAMARFLGVREDTGGKVQGLYLRASGAAAPPGAAAVWVVLLKARRFREGSPVRLLGRDGSRTPVVLRLLHREADEPGGWHVAVEVEAGAAFGAGEVLERYGLPPLPPYILSARRQRGEAESEAADDERYQTVYAERGRTGSVAAPTAGLHFTSELLEKLAASGVDRANVVLHVGSGTFKPIEAGVVEDHDMHEERCSMSGEAVASVVRTREAGGRVIAVGTTSARTLESYALAMGNGGAAPAELGTRLLITPGTHRWRWVDGLLTNFHLPRSTLLAMVAALLEPEGAPAGSRAGLERLLGLYREAIAREYRFFSYGDAMLVLP
ncbi:MAG: tRNA preQ1(34) S-adenosylmethionine ribosyltransferase-isomerase QueA [Phycisphaerales bacterium]|nr:MAG: tRNA preQ1(34) S-adenosylmethionine ribosyltransferase-isomerase QueA [Phycisphaerales bacterium]